MDQYEYYIDQYKQAHQDVDKFPGISLRYYVKDIKKLIDNTETQTLLDFGCGKGLQYTDKGLMEKYGPMPNDVWGITPSLYDPAVPSHCNMPNGTFDGVISTDVMEHVPEEAVDRVLQQIFEKADKFAFMAIATYVGKPTSYKLPNGEQPHITVKADQWWANKMIQNLGDKNIKVQVSFNGRDENNKQVITSWKNF